MSTKARGTCHGTCRGTARQRTGATKITAATARQPAIRFRRTSRSMLLARPSWRTTKYKGRFSAAPTNSLANASCCRLSIGVSVLPRRAQRTPVPGPQRRGPARKARQDARSLARRGRLSSFKLCRCVWERGSSPRNAKDSTKSFICTGSWQLLKELVDPYQIGVPQASPKGHCPNFSASVVHRARKASAGVAS